MSTIVYHVTVIDDGPEPVVWVAWNGPDSIRRTRRLNSLAGNILASHLDDVKDAE